MTNSIEEIGDARCILAIGTNTTDDHPIIALEIKKAIVDYVESLAKGIGR